MEERKMEKLWNFLKDEEGIETIEWAVLAGVFALGMIATITAFIPEIDLVYTKISGTLLAKVPVP
jgi:Flp pilus assembly pilin Flp